MVYKDCAPAKKKFRSEKNNRRWQGNMSKLKIMQIRSTIEKPEPQKRVIQALGLGKIRRVVIHKNNPQIRGMINAVKHLVSVEEVK